MTSRIALLQLLGSGLILGHVSLAEADGYEECNQILVQDIFNRTTSLDTSKTVSKSLRAASFFSSSESEAFARYSRDYEEAHAKGQKIDAEGHYGIGGGEFTLALNSESRLSESEFNQQYRRAKVAYQSSSSSEQLSNQELVSTYASQVRDPETVRAWSNCVSKTREMGVYAFASRDSADKVYVNVMWVPGPFAASAPSIPITFVTDGEAGGVKVLAQPNESVAVGSGRRFAVQCGKVCDEGFSVAFNATLESGGKLVNSFSNSVEVPKSKVAEAQACPWDGTWETEWTAGGKEKYFGIVRLEAGGDTVTGKYDFGTILLSGNQNSLAGRWSHDKSYPGTPCSSGTVTFQKDGCGFHGAWACFSDAPKFSWNGTRLR